MNPLENEDPYEAYLENHIAGMEVEKLKLDASLSEARSLLAVYRQKRGKK